MKNDFAKNINIDDTDGPNLKGDKLWRTEEDMLIIVLI